MENKSPTHRQTKGFLTFMVDLDHEDLLGITRDTYGRSRVHQGSIYGRYTLDLDSKGDFSGDDSGPSRHDKSMFSIPFS